MPETKLKPCPFCGGKAYIHDAICDDGAYLFTFVQCHTCKANIEGFSSKEKAIEAWNRRTENGRCNRVV